MAAATTTGEPGTPTARRASRGIGLAWLGLLPFFLFAFAFLFLPVAYLVVGSFLTSDGAVSLQNYADLSTGIIPGAFATSIEISLVTAIGGGIFGFLLAAAVILGGLPHFLRTALMTFSGVASNFAGVPLALAFIFTLGTLGFVTVLLRDIGIDTATRASLTTKLGLEIVYMYFQFPLMILIIAPALDGLRREWREAAENAGASAFQYWRYVALPILAPSILGAMILLFGNSFGAQATAYQLTGGIAEHHHPRHQLADPRRRAPQPGAGVCRGHGHGRDHGHVDRAVLGAPASIRTVAPRMSEPAMSPTNRQRSTRRRPSPWRLAGNGAGPAPRGRGSCSSSGRSISSCPWSATFIHSIRTRPDIVPRLPAGARRPGLRRRARLLVHDRRDHDRRQPRDHRPDRVLGPAQGAAPAPRRRVRDADAVRHPAGRSSSSG